MSARMHARAPAAAPAAAAAAAAARRAPPPRRRAAVRAGRRDIDEVLEDTPGVASLLERDFPRVEINAAAFAEDAGAPAAAAPRAPRAPALQEARAAEQAAAGGPQRARAAIDAGLAAFAGGDFQGALDFFQLALELPGAGAVRLAGS
jgi:hypothetical protein